MLLAKEQSKTPGAPTGRNMVRLTVPPAQPVEASPVVRGAMPNNDQVGQRFSQPIQVNGSTWQPVYPVQAAPANYAHPPPNVQLGGPVNGRHASRRFPHPDQRSPRAGKRSPAATPESLHTSSATGFLSACHDGVAEGGAESAIQHAVIERE